MPLRVMRLELYNRSVAELGAIGGALLFAMPTLTGILLAVTNPTGLLVAMTPTGVRNLPTGSPVARCTYCK
jgi:hypothetical protein